MVSHVLLCVYVCGWVGADVCVCVAMSPAEVTDKLQLHKMKDRIWFVVPSCATTGEGLFEGLAWLSNNVKTQPAPRK